MKSTVVLEKLSLFDKKGNVVGEFEFSIGLNFFWGENSSGKTALFKGFVYALGVNIDLPDIYKNIGKITLKLKKDDVDVFIHRFTTQQVFLVENDGVEKTFHNEADYSVWLFSLFGLKKQNLSQKYSKDPTPLYFSVLLPYLLIDQDHGWTQCYYNFGRSQFIMAQSEEGIRNLGMLPPKYPFELTQEVKILDNEIKQMKRQRTIAKETAKALETKVKKVISSGPQRLENEITEIKNSLNEFKTGVISAGLALKPYEMRGKTIEERLYLIYESKSKDRREIDLYKRLIQGIDDELSLLNDNDTSIELLRSFCSSATHGGCGLFSGSKDTYAKRLYYLKDQVKDFATVVNGLETKIKEMDVEEASLRDEQASLNIKKKAAFEANVGGEKTFEAITELSKSLLDSEGLLMMLNRYNKYAKEADDLSTKISTNSILLEQKEAMVKGLDSSDLQSFVQNFGTHLNSWLDSLDVINVNRPVTINKEFEIVFSDGKIFDQSSNQSGSTRARIILAYTAALLESMTDNNSQGVRFVWLDTPRQHELKMEDLTLYFTKLGDLAKKRGLTIISGVTDLPVDEKSVNTFKPNTISNGKPYFINLKADK